MSRLLARLLIGCLLLASALLVGQPSAAAQLDDSDAAWATIRAKVPVEQPLYRPTWLPDRFRQPGVAATQGPINAGVSYRSEQGDAVVFVYVASNSCATPEPTPTEPILVHGNTGSLITFPPTCSPRIGAYWQVNNRAYSIQAGPVTEGGVLLSREEMLHIVAGLALVGPDGAALPQPASSALPGAMCYNETGQCMAGPFRAYWEAHGGLALNGYPLTGEMLEQLEDGRIYQVQYFERTRLEYHPENAGTPYEVLLGQFGRRILADIPGAPTAPVPPQAGYPHFAETGHNVGPRFMAYWQANGGLAQFGYPLTELFEQQLEDGQTYQVQYFERARFELHPENTAPNDILLGQFGRRILNSETPNAIAIDPASGPCRDASTSVAVRGSGFTPSIVTRFTIRRDRDGEITGGDSLSGGKQANIDGTYTDTIPLIGCGPSDPPGSTFTITVTEYTPDRTPVNGPSASATFTVTAP